MDAAELAQLLTPEGMALLDRTPSVSDGGEIVRVVSRLRGEGHDPGLVAAVLTQAKLRQKAGAKFGPFASRMLFTEAGLEQATRLQVAAQHAGRFAAAGLTRVADLGCGIGGDAMAMAALDLDVTAVDRDEVTAAVATHNLAPW
ncbi:MAG: SAM-dependent methyltransferase, partial [Curtobacterium sp.]